MNDLIERKGKKESDHMNKNLFYHSTNQNRVSRLKCRFFFFNDQ